MLFGLCKLGADIMRDYGIPSEWDFHVNQTPGLEVSKTSKMCVSLDYTHKRMTGIKLSLTVNLLLN